ncbi:hypothetical protein Y032_0209g2112 [Ancylostoma ceylanicum]|uniref:Uncharacterized protein n=1 Tax=Ancylostoma ceylanicum TaxID=53326 RepID=A0A016SLG2_9BILA|nr:hypothetical protein Y032_0209g2112 [Ancylostoma ceylanicum]
MLNKKELLPGVLSQLNFACVFGPGCYDTCSECRECSLMQDNIRRAVLREVQDSKCQEMDVCIRSCIRDDQVDPYGCIFRERCAPLCMEREGCQSCYSVMRRIFTAVCYRQGFSKLFQQKCRPLFHLLAKDLAITKSWWR